MEETYNVVWVGNQLRYSTTTYIDTFGDVWNARKLIVPESNFIDEIESRSSF